MCSALGPAVQLHLDFLIPCFHYCQGGSHVIPSNCSPLKNFYITLIALIFSERGATQKVKFISQKK